MKLNIRGEEAAVEHLKVELIYPNKEAAQKQLEALNTLRKNLQTEISNHEQAQASAKEAVDGTEGGLKTLNETLPKQEQDVVDAKKALKQKLEETGFNDLSSALDALKPIGDADGERWLTERKKALDDYARTVENTCTRIDALTKQTAGKKLVDLEALKTELKEAKELQTSASDAVIKQNAILQGHNEILTQVSAAKDILAGTDSAWQRISRLALLAEGASSDIGKLSFDRYVMGAIFREVLEMANHRLDIMTGGRFELIHVVEAGRKNAIAGLELEVLDRETGKQRASGSISGGEGFMVSLALALGLSDVVQNHAGGQKLDTLFIDEGFGTLDDGKLDNVITVLKQLTEGNRLVGVISHIDKLDESIQQKIRINSGAHGSTLELEFS